MRVARRFPAGGVGGKAPNPPEAINHSSFKGAGGLIADERHSCLNEVETGSGGEAETNIAPGMGESHIYSRCGAKGIATLQ